MMEIFDSAGIEDIIERKGIRNYFDTPNLRFQAFRYEKGEYITTPHNRLNMLLFAVEGTVQIYDIRENGSLTPVNQHKDSCILGDIEFIREGKSSFYAEAKTPVLCIALSFEKYRNQLNGDVRFLHCLLNSYASKLELYAMLDTAAPTLEERVLIYLKNMCVNATMCSVESAVAQLHCSRRQIQRVLKKLCENGKIQKIGKGSYRLNGQTPPPQ